MADRMTDAEWARAWAARCVANPEQRAMDVDDFPYYRSQNAEAFVDYLYFESWEEIGNIWSVAQGEHAALLLCFAADVMETL